MKPCVPDKLPITTIKWEPLIPLIGASNRALAYFDGILQGITNPDVLLAVPLLDQMFKQPVFPSNIFDDIPGMPTKAAILTMLNKLKTEKMLKILRRSSGRRPQVLALTELINVCEGHEVMQFEEIVVEGKPSKKENTNGTHTHQR